MVAGIAISAGVAGKLLAPFALDRLGIVAGGVVLVAFLLSLAGVAGLERRTHGAAEERARVPESRR